MPKELVFLVINHSKNQIQMTYFLNLSLPLYFMLLPLGIAVVLAAKYYQSQSIFSKMKANYQAQLREAQNRLDTALNAEAENIERLTNVHREKLNKLQSDAVEREILVRTLRADISNDSEIWQGRIKDKVATICDKQVEIGQLERQIAELKLTEQFNEAILSSDAIVQNQLRNEIAELKDLNDILYGIIQANSRTRKAYDKYLTSKPIAGADESAPLGKIIHDNLGNVTVRLADQSESVNNRHSKLIEQALQKGNEIIELCDEVNRGIKEQAERIRQELEVVDMSTLEGGDMVKFRNDITRTIYKIDFCKSEGVGDSHTIKIRFSDNPFNHYYDKAGNYEVNREDPMDIIKIIKATKCYKSNKPCDFGCNGLCKDA